VDYIEKCYRSGEWEGKSKEFIEQYRERYLKMAKKISRREAFPAYILLASFYS
jgi:DNA-binding transcriptional regulator PaaX